MIESLEKSGTIFVEKARSWSKYGIEKSSTLFLGSCKALGIQGKDYNFSKDTLFNEFHRLVHPNSNIIVACSKINQNKYLGSIFGETG